MSGIVEIPRDLKKEFEKYLPIRLGWLWMTIWFCLMATLTIMTVKTIFNGIMAPGQANPPWGFIGYAGLTIFCALACRELSILRQYPRRNILGWLAAYWVDKDGRFQYQLFARGTDMQTIAEMIQQKNDGKNIYYLIHALGGWGSRSRFIIGYTDQCHIRDLRVKIFWGKGGNLMTAITDKVGQTMSFWLSSIFEDKILGFFMDSADATWNDTIRRVARDLVSERSLRRMENDRADEGRTVLIEIIHYAITVIADTSRFGKSNDGKALRLELARMLHEVLRDDSPKEAALKQILQAMLDKEKLSSSSLLTVLTDRRKLAEQLYEEKTIYVHGNVDGQFSSELAAVIDAAHGEGHRIISELDEDGYRLKLINPPSVP